MTAVKQILNKVLALIYEIHKLYKQIKNHDPNSYLNKKRRLPDRNTI